MGGAPFVVPLQPPFAPHEPEHAAGRAARRQRRRVGRAPACPARRGHPRLQPRQGPHPAHRRHDPRDLDGRRGGRPGRSRLADDTLYAVTGNSPDAVLTRKGGSSPSTSPPGTGERRLLTGAIPTPNGLAVGPDGQAYVGSTLLGTISRVDPDTGAHVHRPQSAAHGWSPRRDECEGRLGRPGGGVHDDRTGADARPALTEAHRALRSRGERIPAAGSCPGGSP